MAEKTPIPDNIFPANAKVEVSLASMTTLGLGGVASRFVTIEDESSAIEAVRWSQEKEMPLAVLGGGSNIVFADGGWDGLVLQSAIRGVEFAKAGDNLRITVGAGEPWDEVVEMAVGENIAGLECMSGIPGWTGATPIQNVGAYGQEVSSVIESVRVLDLKTLRPRVLRAEDCDFTYRSSRFRRESGRFLVLSVSFVLTPGGQPTLRYPELARALELRRKIPSFSHVREAVLELRRSKSMVVDTSDPDSRSAGSFFVNPILETSEIDAVLQRWRSNGVLSEDQDLPGFVLDDGKHKLPSAWLIEKAGFSKGLRRGAVGISSKHALALVHYGGGSSEDLVLLAREIRDGVRERFGIGLLPEPVFLGFSEENPLGSG